MERQKIIMDVDTGSDDAVAIMTAILSPALDLMGITTVAGNKEINFTTSNTLRVVELLGSEVPVYRGCEKPMVCTLLHSRHGDYKGATGVGTKLDAEGRKIEYHTDCLPLPEPTIKEQQESAVFYLVDTLMKSRGDIVLVPTGPLTNIAMAMRIQPKICEKIKAICFMGGGFKVFNATSASEFNIWADPEAAQIVLTSGVPITMVPLDATHRANFTDEDARELRAWNTPVTNLVATLVEERIVAYKAFQPQEILESAPIHDALAVAAVIDPGVLRDVRLMRVDVDISGGFADGQTICDTRAFPDRPPNVRVALDADRIKFTTMVKELLKGWKQA